LTYDLYSLTKHFHISTSLTWASVSNGSLKFAVQPAQSLVCQQPIDTQH